MTDPPPQPDPNPRRLALNALRDQLLVLLANGDFSADDLRAAQQTRDSLALSAGEVRALKAEIYHTLHERAFRNGSFSRRELASLDRLMQFFAGREEP